MTLSTDYIISGVETAPSVRVAAKQTPQAPAAMPDTALSDPFGRKIEYLRLSVTDKCNLRCFYCMPEGCRDFESRADYLTFDEIIRVITAFAELGLKRVRLTGGEPLVRKNLSQLAQRLGRISGIEDLSLSTNALLLAPHARALHETGVSRLNISLDSLKPDRFADITRGGDLSAVIDGLMAAKAEGFSPIKINMLALKDLNDDEFFDVVDFCAEHGFALRFIETMPMGETGRFAQNHYLDLARVREQLAARYELIPAVMPGGGPARYVQVKGTALKIGFITPMSQHFCATCNRVRLGVDGTLYLCLGQEHSYPLRHLLRDGVDDEELKAHLIKALALKPERHEFLEKPGQSARLMSKTGG